MSRAELLRSASIFSGLSDEELEGLALSLNQRTFARGMILFHRGSPGHTLYLVQSGRVRIFLLSEDGQEITLNFHGPGESFGEMALLDGLPRSASAMAMERTVTYGLHRDAFLRQLRSHPHMSEAILEVLSLRLRQLTEYTETLAFLDVHHRVVAKLLELANRYGVTGNGLEIDMLLTQGELANWVVASRESVNRVLGMLRDQGLISLDGKRIIIVDAGGLRRQMQR